MPVQGIACSAGCCSDTIVEKQSKSVIFDDAAKGCQIFQLVFLCDFTLEGCVLLFFFV